MAASRRRRHAHAEEEHENDERWLLTYADMITLLMALFMVLFSISSVNISKFVSLQHSLQDAFSGRILPGGRALEESGGSTVSPQVAATPAASTPAATNEGAGRKAADAAAKAQVKAEEEDFKALKQRVDQYAIAHGLQSKVTTLITKDGLVIRLLTDKLLFASGDATVQPAGAGVAPQRMEAAGRAALDPLNTNVTDEGRARNRRVEVLLPRVATGKAADDATQPERQPRFAPDFGPEGLK